MLDQVVAAVASPSDPAVPAIHPTSLAHEFQFLRRAQLLKTQHTCILYDKLSEWFYPPRQRRMVRVFHWPDAHLDSTFDVCSDPRDRPYFCDAGPLYSGDPRDPGSANVTRIELSVNERVLAAFVAFRSNHSDAEVIVDVTSVEGYTDPWTYAGGLMQIVSAEFEIVVLTRVRECSRPSQPLGQLEDQCLTVRINDYRYEGCTSPVTSTTGTELCRFFVFLRKVTIQPSECTSKRTTNTAEAYTTALSAIETKSE